jgi:hypothetical protein
MGGTNIDSMVPTNFHYMSFRLCGVDRKLMITEPGGSDTSRFLKYFKEELRDAIRGTPKK